MCRQGEGAAGGYLSPGLPAHRHAPVRLAHDPAHWRELEGHAELRYLRCDGQRTQPLLNHRLRRTRPGRHPPRRRAPRAAAAGDDGLPQGAARAPAEQQAHVGAGPRPGVACQGAGVDGPRGLPGRAAGLLRLAAHGHAALRPEPAHDTRRGQAGRYSPQQGGPLRTRHHYDERSLHTAAADGVTQLEQPLPRPGGGHRLGSHGRLRVRPGDSDARGQPSGPRGDPAGWRQAGCDLLDLCVLGLPAQLHLLHCLAEPRGQRHWGAVPGVRLRLREVWQ
mmetsp:Transcript_88312/g.227725  ORF Transcript_88312/g.227725 Transcript_88312/m.227725 type:complete len:278 (+) Transcript_88312:943-1776(+)